MADTYTTRNRFEKMEPGVYADTWASRANGQFGSDLLDAAMDGVEGFALSGSLTLTTANGSSDQARKRVLNVTSGTGGTITIPNLEKAYLVRNASSGNVIITTGSGTTATIKSGNVQFVFCDGSNACYAAKVLDFGSDNITTTGTLTPTTISCPGSLTLTRGWNGTSAQIKFSPSDAGFLNFGSTGSGAPANLGSLGINRSQGTRIVIFEGLTTSTDYAIGSTTGGLSTALGCMWFSVPSTSTEFSFYGGTAVNAAINGGGQFWSLGTYSATTASAANMVIISTGAMQRSTSSSKFKTDIQPLEADYADRWLSLTPIWYRSLCEADNKEWGWYGFTAEDAVKAGLPQLVHWGYADEDFEDVPTPEGGTRKTLKEGAIPTVPDGFQYERCAPFAQHHINKLYQTIAALEARVAALEA
jgi:hypothetical protein